MLKILYLWNPGYEIFNKHMNLTIHKNSKWQVYHKRMSHLLNPYLCDLRQPGSHTLSWNTKYTLWENTEDTARVQKTFSVLKKI